jgi:hypothetical protein
VVNKNNNLANPGRPYGAVWFALLSVAWLQFSIAAHQFDHAAGTADAPCDVCVQLERTDDFVSDGPAVVLLLASSDSLFEKFASTEVAENAIAGFSPRAPPFI